MIEYPIITYGGIVKNCLGPKENVQNSMWWQKTIIHLNNNSMFKDMFLKHGGERRWRVQTFTYTP